MLHNNCELNFVFAAKEENFLLDERSLTFPLLERTQTMGMCYGSDELDLCSKYLLPQ